jgi:hypothetical protein
MRIVFRLNVKREGQWTALGYYKETDAPAALQRGKRDARPGEEIRTGSCTIDCDPRREQWKR